MVRLLRLVNIIILCAIEYPQNNEVLMNLVWVELSTRNI